MNSNITKAPTIWDGINTLGEERDTTKQDYKKAFKKANTKELYTSFSMSEATEMTEGTG